MYSPQKWAHLKVNMLGAKLRSTCSKIKLHHHGDMSTYMLKVTSAHLLLLNVPYSKGKLVAYIEKESSARGLPCWGNSIGAAILHGPAENVFPHKSGYTR